MLILYAILIASVGLSHLADGSAIKGYAHARPQEEARSIKLGSLNNLDKQVKPVAAGQQPVLPVAQAAAPSVPILESTKKIYNDETIRRIAYAQQADQLQQQQQPVVPVKQAVVAAPVVPVEPVVQPQVVPVVAESAPKPVEQVVPVAPAVPVPVPAQAAPVLVQAEPVPALKEQPKLAVVEPKIAPVEPVAVVKPAASEEIPQPSDRSAPIRSSVVQPQAPVALPESVPVVQPVQQPIVPAQVVPVQSVPVQAVPEVVKESPLMAKKDEVAQVEPLHIEVPAPDPGLVLSEPIDSTTKLLIDLDEHVQKFLPAEDQQLPAQAKDQQLVAGVDYSPAKDVPVAQAAAASPADPTGKSSGPLVPYSSSSADDTIVPPLPSLDGVEKASSASGGAIVPSVAGAAAPSVSSSAASSPSATRQGGHQHQNQQQVITQLLDQLDSLQNRIQDTINQLVARRRYVMSALLRPMGTYVRRVRTNLERLQNRVNQLQAAASSVGGQNRPGGGFVDAAAIETIRRRIDDISKRISDIVNRIRFSLTPTSAPLNSNGRK